MDLTPFNPLARENLGASVAEAMLERKADPLSTVVAKSFKGAGIYALYYTGDFAAYDEIARRNREDKFEVPIYVGKAVPAGARKGNVGLSSDPGNVLWARLKDHHDSIAAVTSTLSTNDFYCRLLIVDDIWIPLAESLLISKFAPVWNRIVDGFGNHDPGKGRYEGLRPLWDVLHPGRHWAAKCQNRTETAAHISADVKRYLAVTPAPAKPKLLG